MSMRLCGDIGSRDTNPGAGKCIIMKQKGNITNCIRAFKEPLLIAVIIVVLIALWSREKGLSRKAIEDLTSISPEQVTMVRIYPRVVTPVGTYVEFTPPDPIVEDFFRALADHRSYSYSHDRVFGKDHQWFFEVAAGEVFLQVSFHIPDDNDTIVAGMLGKFTSHSTRSYGDFQSRQLYHWYQKYSHRWLEPEESPPTPSPQPDSPGGE